MYFPLWPLASHNIATTALFPDVCISDIDDISEALQRNGRLLNTTSELIESEARRRIVKCLRE